MNSGMAMRFCSHSIIISIVAAAAVAQGSSQTVKAGIINVTASGEVSVEFQIQGKDKDIVVPYCTRDDDGTYVICAFGVAVLQYFDGKKWARAKPGYPGEVLGFEDSQMNPAPVTAGTAASFRFTFSPRIYHVQSGSRLRLAVHYWNDAEKVKYTGAVGNFVSPSFICP
jgi:hypothetical protein